MAEYKRDTYIIPISNIEYIAYYKTARDGKLYFCCGKTRIEVVEHFAEHDLSMEDWNPPRWKSRLEKACKERYDCEWAMRDIQQELSYLEIIRQALNEIHRRQRRPERDRGER